MTGYKSKKKAAQGKLAEQQEPVAWMVYTLDGTSICTTDSMLIRHSKNFPGIFAGDEFRKRPLVFGDTTPPAPQRPWVSLTDDQIKEIVGPWGDTPIKGYTRELIDKIDAKLRENNNG
jgi:hypothetical protein